MSGAAGCQVSMGDGCPKWWRSFRRAIADSITGNRLIKSLMSLVSRQRSRLIGSSGSNSATPNCCHQLLVTI
jgi:hypothetical protein